MLATLTVQLVAFAIAHSLGEPTLYAVFAVASAGILAAWTGGGPQGTAAAVAATLLVGGLWALLPASLGPSGAWAFLLGPVVLAAVVAVSGERWEGVAAASLGSVLLVLLGLPLALFLVGQDPGLVASRALSPEVHRMLALSLLAPLLAAAISVGFGVPLAYLLARGFAGQSLVESLVDLPLVVPHSVAGIVVLFGFGSGGAFPQLQVLNGVAGMVLAMTFVSAPYAVDAAREAFASVDRSVVWAARSHGASPFEAFRRVTLPLSARGILTGGVLAWGRAVSEFGAVAVVAYAVTVPFPTRSVPPAFEPARTQHAPVYIYNTYVGEGLAEASAVATVLLGVSGAIFLLVRVVAYDEGGILA